MRLAGRQHAVVRSDQLAAAGLTKDAVAHRVKEGRLRRIHRGVYLVASLPAPLTLEMAAVFACGPTAVLSHHAAAALWEIRPDRQGDVDVTVVSRRVRHRSGVRVHRAQRLNPRDVRRRHGIPVTAPARTLLDLAATLPQGKLERALEEAEIRRLVTRRVLTELLDRSNGHAGTGALCAALALHHDPALTRSEAEARLLALIRAAGLPPPQANVRIRGHEVDLFWPDHGLVVEVDGYAYHSTRRAFERDRRRDAELQAAGLQVSRVTWHQIADTPEALVANLAATLATR
jgi:very-short-patch-repair endonuclease